MKKPGGRTDKAAAAAVTAVAMTIVKMMVNEKNNIQQQHEVVTFGKRWKITIERVTLLLAGLPDIPWG